jgi:hypothetical protein
MAEGVVASAYRLTHSQDPRYGRKALHVGVAAVAAHSAPAAG